MQLDEVNQAAAEGKEPAFGVHLDIASYGDMSSFFWAHSQPPPPGLVECNVAYGELSKSQGSHAAAEVLQQIQMQITIILPNIAGRVS